ncbi:YncE family protein [Pelomonas sp. KK5]|uniref:YncE family protein n=1 Tax=Pelomonas sp. KK5 TaxID=1855730 RepID=UPI001E3CE174|nr:YncE family protein [Pelomonas sp. KK5]
MAAAALAYITNQGSHDVSVIDLDMQRVVATVPVGRSPAGVVAASAIGRVFVSNPDSRDISVIDMATQAVVGRLEAGQGPVGIDASADGRRLYVADWYAGQLLVYALDARGAPPVRIPVGRAPAGVAAADGALAYVAERDDDSVAAVDAAAGRVLGRVRVGAHPFALLLDAPRQRLYALNVMSDDVSVVDLRDPARMAVIATIPVGKAPYGAALADSGRLLYVTNQHDDSVSVIDADTLRPLRTLDGFGYPEGIAAQGDKVYVVNWMDDAVSVLDALTGRELRRIATGRNSRGFGAFIGQLPSNKHKETPQ